MDILFAALPNKPLLRIDEVAAFFSISKRTVYRWYPNFLDGTQINGVTFIYRQSVIELVLKNNGKKKNEEMPEEIDRKIKKGNRRVLSAGL
jgi:hypothetical protein